ncbi:MAG: hypothetical protein COB62_07320 [Piscirickettsiaceae bacterium]|nr:MAG: hypothetical protein COB62_07320 [Piscirickettsiaceae bacterium]
MKRLKYLYYLIALFSCAAVADGSVIDKVYHPYVQPLEKEFEWRMISADDVQNYRLAIGMSLSDRLFVEAYLIGKDVNNHLKFDAYEIEAIWQLTEQGEYSVDWGLLFEIEKEQHDDTWEVSTGLLMEKEWGRWVGTANVKVIYEWGPEIKDELETALATQLRYRYKPYLEPAVEFYSGENGIGLGPVLMGDLRLASAKKLHWEVGAILGLDADTASNTWRLLMEFEF